MQTSMRPAVVITILLLALAIGGTVVFFSRVASRQSLTVQTTNAAAVQVGTSTSTPAISVANAFNQSLITAGNMTNTAALTADTQADHAEQVQNRVDELMKLAMNDDPDSLNIIWSEISNPDKDIRAGALAALVQFGDRSVTPRLRELAAQTEDPHEKLEILAAADQLDLPPMSSLPGKQRTNGPQ